MSNYELIVIGGTSYTGDTVTAIVTAVYLLNLVSLKKREFHRIGKAVIIRLFLSDTSGARNGLTVWYGKCFFLGLVHGKYRKYWFR